MRVLVSTTETQGQRRSDFCHVSEGELVTFPFECDCDRDDVDGHCGCRRSMSGVKAHRATTTMKVAELPGDREALLALLAEGLRASGWERVLGADETHYRAQWEATETVRVASFFPLGAVLEKRGDEFSERFQQVTQQAGSKGEHGGA